MLRQLVPDKVDLPVHFFSLATCYMMMNLMKDVWTAVYGFITQNLQFSSIGCIIHNLYIKSILIEFKFFSQNVKITLFKQVVYIENASL